MNDKGCDYFYLWLWIPAFAKLILLLLMSPGHCISLLKSSFLLNLHIITHKHRHTCMHTYKTFVVLKLSKVQGNESIGKISLLQKQLQFEYQRYIFLKIPLSIPLLEIFALVVSQTQITFLLQFFVFPSYSFCFYLDLLLLLPHNFKISSLSYTEKFNVPTLHICICQGFLLASWRYSRCNIIYFPKKDYYIYCMYEVFYDNYMIFVWMEHSCESLWMCMGWGSAGFSSISWLPNLMIK